MSRSPVLSDSVLCPSCGTRRSVRAFGDGACPACHCSAEQREGLRVECPVCASLPGHRCGIFPARGRNKHPYCHDKRVSRERRLVTIRERERTGHPRARQPKGRIPRQGAHLKARALGPPEK